MRVGESERSLDYIRGVEMAKIACDRKPST